jgi:CHAD domain-containing protein
MSNIAIRLRDHMDSLVEQLRTSAPLALAQWDDDAVHDSRVATRRIKAAMDLVEGAVDASRWKPFAKLGRKLRRRLGPLRDLDVMLAHLTELQAGPSRDDARSPHGRRAARQRARLDEAVQWVSERLHEQRRQVRSECGEVNVARVLSRLGDWWGIREEIACASGHALAGKLAQSLRQQLEEFTDTAAALAMVRPPALAEETPAVGEASSRAESPAPPPMLESTDPHALRIVGKRLRYTLELAAAGGVAVPKPLFSTFKRLQGDLGSWHDYVVLHQRIVELSLRRELACHNRELYGAVLELSRVTWHEAQAHLRRFMARWRRVGPGIRQRIVAKVVAPMQALEQELSQTGELEMRPPLPALDAPRHGRESAGA